MLKSLFKRKTKQNFCELLLQHSSSWIDALITYIDINENVIKLFVNCKKPVVSLENGQKLKVKSIRDGKEFVFNGVMTNVETCIFGQTVTINIEEVKIFHDNRKSERYIYKCEVLISGKGSFAAATLCDLSFGGVLIITDKRIENPNGFNIEVFAFPGETIVFSAEVLRCDEIKDKYKYALKIKDIDSNSIKVLNKLIAILAMQKNKLINEWKVVDKVQGKEPVLFKWTKI